MSVQEIQPNLLIKRLSGELSKLKELSPPEWSRFSHTGVHKVAHRLNNLIGGTPARPLS